jgi:hypothetical protein
MGTKGVWAWKVIIIDVDILRHFVVHFLSTFSFCSVGEDKEPAAILRKFGTTNGKVFDVTNPESKIA